MTHDYAKKPSAPKKRKKRKTSKKKSSQVPGWVWLFTGIIAGLFIAFLAYLADIDPRSEPEEQAEQLIESPETDNKDSVSDSDSDSDSDTEFSFYTLLPEREIIVPVEAEDETIEPREKVFYLLQTGSFRNAADADRQRASLLLLGLEAKIDKIKGKNGDIWHRVQVGPYTNRSKLAKARSTLVNQGINPLTLKKKSA